MSRIIDTGAGLMMEVTVDGRLTFRSVTAERDQYGVTYRPEVRDNEALLEFVGGHMVIVKTRE